jgi:hypothetical protein
MPMLLSLLSLNSSVGFPKGQLENSISIQPNSLMHKWEAIQPQGFLKKEKKG